MDQMICEIEVQIKNADGLHMRPAMQFVDIANQYDSEVTVSNENNSVDGKSIMQMSMLAATYGSTLKIRVQGPDAEKVIESLRHLVEDKKFDEPAPGEEQKD